MFGCSSCAVTCASSMKRRERAGLGVPALLQRLDGHGAADGAVERARHQAHAARAEQLADLCSAAPAAATARRAARCGVGAASRAPSGRPDPWSTGLSPSAWSTRPRATRAGAGRATSPRRARCPPGRRPAGPTAPRAPRARRRRASRAPRPRGRWRARRGSHPGRPSGDGLDGHERGGAAARDAGHRGVARQVRHRGQQQRRTRRCSSCRSPRRT